ncbi:amidase domain-containing protein [Rhodococcus erythropolis]|uniref:Amidase domain-containing protein n=1 Tax=Rhodococcus erythropolis TaxID=1833 RepID=A0AAX3ZXW4_RHOER|nr:amidase domain-containing protein [Rhodococcus erythropolis]WMN01888.1 amidase domain-containing protein [Rhodococcus erythropolis]WMN03174.1 amidase domain-containing protein [Rhodococcus erythropolis]
MLKKIAAPTVVAATAALTFTLISPPANADPSCPNNDPKHGYCIGGKVLEEYVQAGDWPFFKDALQAEGAASRNGRWQPFASGNSIYWHPLVSGGHANQIGGLIRQKWYDAASARGVFPENSPLRYPTTRELATRNSGGGRYNRFEGGNIYWSQSTGAHVVWGGILEQWGRADYEAGYYGLPTSDEYQTPAGWSQDFVNGTISFLNAPGNGYNRDNALAYADRWSSTDPASNLHNPDFPDYSQSNSANGGDCTNFVSQAIYAGGIPLTGPHDPVGGLTNRAQPNIWNFYTQPTGGRGTSYTWGGEPNFLNYLTHPNINGVTTGKIVGTTNARSDKLAPLAPFGVQKGDLLFYDWGTGAGIDHVMIVAGLDRPTNNDGLAYQNATVVDGHTSNRHHALWSIGPNNPDWRTMTVTAVQITQ